MEQWNYIYNQFDPVAFSLGFFSVHWYGIMYLLALLSALWFGSYIVKKDKLPITKEELDSYFIWIEIGVILGARFGYIIFYDPNKIFYLTHPWEAFNPFRNGEFVGIRGMSYHGALIGFLLSSYLYTLKHKKQQFWFLMDLVAISVPLGYIFGRIGNFLNQELVGRATDLSIGIYVAGIKRHPSQLYEALLEGVLVFLILYLYRHKKRFQGELAALYGILYGIARFVAEFFREPDSQLGYLCCHLSMGQLLSLFMATLSLALYFYLYQKSIKAR